METIISPASAGRAGKAVQNDSRRKTVRNSLRSGRNRWKHLCALSWPKESSCLCCLSHSLPDSDSFTSLFRSVWGSFFLRYCVSSLSVWCEPIAGGCTDNGNLHLRRCKYLSSISENSGTYKRENITRQHTKSKANVARRWIKAEVQQTGNATF